MQMRPNTTRTETWKKHSGSERDSDPRKLRCRYHQTYSTERSWTLYLIKNWRPVSLLNSDYKIAAKANRFKQVLPNLIDNDRTGFLKGRFIGENICLTDSIINTRPQKASLVFYFFLTMLWKSFWHGRVVLLAQNTTTLQFRPNCYSVD